MRRSCRRRRRSCRLCAAPVTQVVAPVVRRRGSGRAGGRAGRAGCGCSGDRRRCRWAPAPVGLRRCGSGRAGAARAGRCQAVAASGRPRPSLRCSARPLRSRRSCRPPPRRSSKWPLRWPRPRARSPRSPRRSHHLGHAVLVHQLLRAVELPRGARRRRRRRSTSARPATAATFAQPLAAPATSFGRPPPTRPRPPEPAARLDRTEHPEQPRVDVVRAARLERPERLRHAPPLAPRPSAAAAARAKAAAPRAPRPPRPAAPAPARRAPAAAPARVARPPCPRPRSAARRRKDFSPTA